MVGKNKTLEFTVKVKAHRTVDEEHKEPRYIITMVLLDEVPGVEKAGVKIEGTDPGLKALLPKGEEFTVRLASEQTEILKTTK